MNETALELNQRGLAALRTSDHVAAADYFRQSAEADPAFATAHNHLGGALSLLGRYDEAIAAFEQALALDSQSPDAHHNLGYTLAQVGRHDEAIERLQRAVELRRNFPDAWNNLGNALDAAGRSEEAIEAYRTALQFAPAFALAHNGLGNALSNLGQWPEALDCYGRAIQADPNYAQAFNNAGLALRQLGRSAEAAQCFERAAALSPQFADAFANLGVVFADMRKPDEAIAAFTRALELDPGNSTARGQRLFQLARNCDWDAMEADREWLPKLGIEGGLVPLFSMLSLDPDPMRQRQRAERFAATMFKPAVRQFAKPKARPDRLRIGYFSADYHDHATMYLMAGMFEAHDRQRFHTTAYSYGRPIRDSMRERAEKAFDSFVDVSSLSAADIAAKAREDGIDIAVDLKGYTEGNRMAIFAERAARLQVSFMGFCGTSGASFIDYLVADRTVIPPEQRDAYSEKLIALPQCYLVNDDSRPTGEGWTRERAGLPETGYVFCCLVNSYKITPAEFDIWMRLLAGKEGSVLWLLVGSETGRSHLREQARRRGVDPDRLVFADQVPLADHIARLKLADLFVDTFNYNAHTTGCDALWAGVPVITMPGASFSSRVGASILETMGLPELIVDNPESYEQLAMELANDPAALSAMAEKVRLKRDTSPMFNATSFARHLETAFDEAFSRYIKGLKPADIIIG
jgi:predicted O-linked N-acetylglucosamine transferase (SPINDLY family)